MMSHNERLYREVGPQKVEDVQHAYAEGWIDEDGLERDLDLVLGEEVGPGGDA